jgi:hypothetical protein
MADKLRIIENKECPTEVPKVEQFYYAELGRDGFAQRECVEHHDPVNHPKHYTQHPSGVECIQVVEHMNFCIGNVIKYCWRAGLKGEGLEDLKKARFYLEREIERIEKQSKENA